MLDNTYNFSKAHTHKSLEIDFLVLVGLKGEVLK